MRVQHTKKTTEFISRDSEKYMDRVYNRPGAPQGEKGMGKKGSLADGTDAAHKLSWGLMNAVVTHTPGRPFGEEKRAAIAREMNSSENLRIKSDYGNKTLDERRDARIAEAYVSGGSLRGGTTVERAYQAFQAARNMESLESVADALGNMTIHTGKPGRPPMVKNYEKNYR